MNTKYTSGVIRALGLSLCLVAGPALADSSVSRVSILPGWQMENGHRMIGVRIEMEPGWKTYWRAPGGMGIPPQLDFAGSENVRATRTYWPRPKVYDTGGYRTIGYADEVVFPVELIPNAAGDIGVDLSIFYGVCEEVCIPASTSLVGAFSPTDSGGAGMIRAALANRAVSGQDAGVRGLTCEIKPEAEGFSVTATLNYGAAPEAGIVPVFETGSEEIWITPLTLETQGREVRIEAMLDYYGEGAMALDRGDIRLSLISDARTVEIQGCPAS